MRDAKGTREKKNDRVKTRGREAGAGAAIFCVTHGGLSERGTTRSLLETRSLSILTKGIS